MTRHRYRLFLLTLLTFTSTCGVTTTIRGAAAEDESANRLTEAEKRGKWQLLFDGKSTDGWRNYRKSDISDGWTIKDGALTREKPGAGDIVTEDTYKYFELTLEYRISKGGNSGLMFHVAEDASSPGYSGPEIQIQDNVDGRDPQKAGWLYQLYKPVKPDWARRVEKEAGIQTPEVDDATRPAGQWNQIYLRVSPRQSEVAINGVSYYYFLKGSADWKQRVAQSKFATSKTFAKADQGHISLQDHGDLVAFRNIKIRRLTEEGAAPEPIDGILPLQAVSAFPGLKWEGWTGVDQRGRIMPLRPMVLTALGNGRILVADQSGMLHAWQPEKEQQAKLVLDIRARVAPWREGNEEGLLGCAPHPDFASNRQVFVYYTSRKEPHTSIVSRFYWPKQAQRMDPASEEIVMKIPQPFSNHNGGSIAFGPDGFLYIALGDGGGRNDPLRHGQNLKTLMGSILRIDVTGRTEKKLAYAIPRDNPFLNQAGARPEIFAFGMRNVWRISFDQKTGSLWAADVGQDLWEEINLIRKGGNYGWSSREASKNFGNLDANKTAAPIRPVWEYDHQVGKSITGGYVYRGKKLPLLQGAYLYADYVTGKIWALYYDQQNQKVIKNMQIVAGGIPVLAFGQDEQGEVYYLVESAKGETIFRFVSSR